MRSPLALLVLAAATLALSACGIVYKLPTRQGNVIEQKQLDQLKTGMTRDQVKFLLGTPIAKTPLRDDRWDYVGYYKNPRGKVFQRTVSLFFDGDSLARMDGQKPPAGEDGSATPDLERIEKEEHKAATEAERDKSQKDSGVVIQQPKKE
jgi:outer membrane protein assembly factor BamE